VGWGRGRPQTHLAFAEGQLHCFFPDEHKLEDLPVDNNCRVVTDVCVVSYRTEPLTLEIAQGLVGFVLDKSPFR
jgi:hypothetical protein